MKSHFHRLARSRWLQITVSCIISVWAIYLAMRNLSLQEVGRVFSEAEWGYLLPALIAVAVHHGVKALRWKLLLSPLPVAGQTSVSLRDLFLVLMAGQMLNLVYPARLGDFSRIWLIGNRGYGKAATSGTLVLEKLIDTTYYAILLILLALLITIPDWLASSWIFLGSLLVTFGLLWLIISKDKIWIRLSGIMNISRSGNNTRKESILGWIHSFRDGIAGLQQLKGNLPFARLFLWSSTAWAMSFVINWLVSKALSISFESLADTLAAQLLVLVALQVGIAVPSLPGRIGLFEYICMLALGVFGIGSSESFGYGVLLHIIVMVPTLLTGWVGLMIFGLDRKQVLHEVITD